MGDALAQSGDLHGVCTVAIAFDDLDLDRQALAAAIGYEHAPLPEHFADLLEQALGQARRLCRPQAGYRLLESSPVAGRPDCLRVDQTIFNTQKIVAAALGPASHVAVFACSLGRAFEDWARAHLNGDEPALGYIADAVGSAAADALASRLHQHLTAAMAPRGWPVTNRYSPGYCNWSVAEQRALFGLLPANFCGISLSESALMTPIKSISGLIGTGPNATYSDYLCDVCHQRDCLYRRQRETRKGNRPASGH